MTLVVDASALVDVLLGGARGRAGREAMAGEALVAPAHVDAEVLSALGRLHRADALDAARVDTALRRLATLPMERRPLASLLADAWALRDNVRMTDALYVALAVDLDAPLLTSDHRLVRAVDLLAVPVTTVVT